MWSFVITNLKGKSGLFCSPSTKSSNQLHGIIVISISLYKPQPLGRCGNHMKSFLKKDPKRKS
jgi:hypothetical protein